MHLLIDVGNSRIKWALMIDDNDESIETQSGSLKELAEFISSINVSNTKVLLAAVNQTAELTTLLTDAKFKALEIVRTKVKQAGIQNSYEQPERMGVDRWLAMIAAYHCESSTGTKREGYVVVDAGSAMTIDVLDGAGVHQGGYIVPGLVMAETALFSTTEQVNRYAEPSLPDGLNSQRFKLGKNTVQCVEYGVISQLVSLVKMVKDQYLDYKLTFTGGDGELLARFFDDSVVDPNLVLKGLWQVRN